MSSTLGCKWIKIKEIRFSSGRSFKSTFCYVVSIRSKCFTITLQKRGLNSHKEEISMINSHANHSQLSLSPPSVTQNSQSYFKNHKQQFPPNCGKPWVSPAGLMQAALHATISSPCPRTSRSTACQAGAPAQEHQAVLQAPLTQLLVLLSSPKPLW